MGNVLTHEFCGDDKSELKLKFVSGKICSPHPRVTCTAVNVIDTEIMRSVLDNKQPVYLYFRIIYGKIFIHKKTKLCRHR
jgi:hypothetical protein